MREKGSREWAAGWSPGHSPDRVKAGLRWQDEQEEPHGSPQTLPQPGLVKSRAQSHAAGYTPSKATFLLQWPS